MNGLGARATTETPRPPRETHNRGGMSLARRLATRPGSGRHRDRKIAAMGNDIDLHLGKRLRRRRRLLGLTQQQLASVVGVRFQQIQKYECGANRISAARLWSLAEALDVPVGYFYDGLAQGLGAGPAGERGEGGEVLARKETLDLVRAYYQLGERPRRRLLDLAKSLNGDVELA
jgi:transcriptional regulator with XRE-family HTH domain